MVSKQPRDIEDIPVQERRDILKKLTEQISDGVVKPECLRVPPSRVKMGLRHDGLSLPNHREAEEVEVWTYVVKPVIEAVMDDGDIESGAEKLKQRWPDNEVDAEMMMRMFPEDLEIDSDELQRMITK